MSAAQPASGSGSRDLTGFRVADDAPVYAISVAAELAGLHPQTLRQYDRLGLVIPTRVGGRNRLYSANDIARLREIADLSARACRSRASGASSNCRRRSGIAAPARSTSSRREQASTALVICRPATRPGWS